MEIQGPMTIEELQDANTLFVPKLLRGSVRRQMKGTLNPPKWRLALLAVIGVVYLVAIMADPRQHGPVRWILLLLLAVVFGYRIFFAAKASRAGYASRIKRLPRIMSVDSDGLRFEDREKRFEFRPWSGYNKWREGDLVWVLKGPQRTAHIVPKRDLTNAQKDELRKQFEAMIRQS